MTHTWKDLSSEDQLDTITQDSNHKAVVVFKHSTRCGISHHALERLQDGWDFEEENFDFYYLDLLSYRGVSNEVGDRFGVIHQSPQLIVIKNGRATADISHQGISVNWLKSQL